MWSARSIEEVIYMITSLRARSPFPLNISIESKQVRSIGSDIIRHALFVILSISGSILLGVGRVFKIGDQPLNTRTEFFNDVRTAAGGADWQLQTQLQLLLSKGVN